MDSIPISTNHVIIIAIFPLLQAQRPEQSVMQALESLNDSQVNIAQF